MEGKCSECGKSTNFPNEMYCKLSGRGANSLCLPHPQQLVCDDCSQKYLIKKGEKDGKKKPRKND